MCDYLSIINWNPFIDWFLSRLNVQHDKIVFATIAAAAAATAAVISTSFVDTFKNS